MPENQVIVMKMIHKLQYLSLAELQLSINRRSWIIMKAHKIISNMNNLWDNSILLHSRDREESFFICSDRLAKNITEWNYEVEITIENTTSKYEQNEKINMQLVGSL